MDDVKIEHLIEHALLRWGTYDFLVTVSNALETVGREEGDEETLKLSKEIRYLISEMAE